MYIPFNPNPKHIRVGDCTVRAISKVMNMAWEETYVSLCDMGYELADMPSANHVWGEFLKENGFVKEVTDCDTVRCFAKNNRGTFVLALSGHVVAVVDGDYYDSWDSGDEAIIYVWRKK